MLLFLSFFLLQEYRAVIVFAEWQAIHLFAEAAAPFDVDFGGAEADTVQA
jgi:hypothetical protein